MDNANNPWLGLRFKDSFDIRTKIFPVFVERVRILSDDHAWQAIFYYNGIKINTYQKIRKERRFFFSMNRHLALMSNHNAIWGNCWRKKTNGGIQCSLRRTIFRLPMSSEASSSLWETEKSYGKGKKTNFPHLMILKPTFSHPLARFYVPS